MMILVMKRGSVFSVLILIGCFRCLKSQAGLYPVLGLIPKPHYDVPTAKPPAPTISPTIPKASSQQLLFGNKGFIFPNPTIKSSTTTSSKISDCKPTIPIISRSVPCNESAVMKIELSHTDLSTVLADEGGSYVRQYMATEESEATRNFKNLLSLNEMYEDRGSRQHTENWVWDYSLTKAKLIEQLDKKYSELYAAKSAPSIKEHISPLEITWNEKNVMNNIFKAPLSSTNIYIKRKSDEQLVSEAHKIQKRSRNRRFKNVKQRNKRKGSGLLRNHDRFPKHVLDQVVPANRIYRENERVKRDSTGSVSVAEYCTKRGDQSAGGYLHMCTTCSHTTRLADDKFPRIINEVVCHSSDRGCIFTGSTSHGSCHQNVMYLTMLRKKPGRCMMVIHNGGQVLTDEWEPYSQPIRVSCECRIDKRSPFARYLNPN